jgi:hypothetical protein
MISYFINSCVSKNSRVVDANNDTSPSFLSCFDFVFFLFCFFWVLEFLFVVVVVIVVESSFLDDFPVFLVLFLFALFSSDTYVIMLSCMLPFSSFFPTISKLQHMNFQCSTSHKSSSSISHSIQHSFQSSPIHRFSMSAVRFPHPSIRAPIGLSVHFACHSHC